MSEQTFPDPFLTNVLNAELVAQNKLGYLLINLDKTIIPLKLDKDYFIDDDYFIEYQYYDSQYNKSFMKINKIIDKNNSTLVTLIKSKSFKLEPIHFDFSNLNSVKNKIKTIIAFK